MNHTRITALVLLIVLVLTGACTPSLSETAEEPSSAAVSPESTRSELTVLAAASLTESFQALGNRFEEQHSGVRVAFNFAGSQQLVQQLANGADADVFASANLKQMDNAVKAGRITPGDTAIFAQNQLVIIFPRDNPAQITQPTDLAKPGLKLVLAASEVPAGQYALEFLDIASNDPEFGADFSQRVQKNVVSYENTVRGVLTKVLLGEADAGIVYSTDAASVNRTSEGGQAEIGEIEIPSQLNVTAEYPIAVINDSPDPALANAFLDLVLSPEGQQILSDHGFMPITE